MQRRGLIIVRCKRISYWWERTGLGSSPNTRSSRRRPICREDKSIQHSYHAIHPVLATAISTHLDGVALEGEGEPEPARGLHSVAHAGGEVHPAVDHLVHELELEACQLIGGGILGRDQEAGEVDHEEVSGGGWGEGDRVRVEEGGDKGVGREELLPIEVEVGGELGRVEQGGPERVLQKLKENSAFGEALESNHEKDSHSDCRSWPRTRRS